MAYTASQLMQLWKDAGGSAIAAPMAAAIALAESGGDAESENSNRNGSTDRGLWHINSIHGALSTFDPIANARAAVQISKNGSDWRPWCTAWSDGACGGTFMGAAAPVLKFLGSGSYTGQTPSAAGLNLPNPLNPLGDLNPSNWLNAAFKTTFYMAAGFVGLVGMVFGIWLLVMESRTAQLVKGLGGAALGAAPQTRAAGVAIQADAQNKLNEKDSMDGSGQGPTEADKRAADAEMERLMKKAKSREGKPNAEA